MTNKISVISQSPYYDDYKSSAGFIRVLFRPSFPVQARELNTIQSILQNQVTSFGDTIHKDGSRITNGTISIIENVEKLTLLGSSHLTYTPAGAESGSNLANITELEDTIITNATGTVKARVIRQPGSTTGVTNSNTTGSLYVQYLTGNTFDSDGFLYAKTTDNPSKTLKYYNTISGKSTSCVAQIEAGIYYVRGVFVEVAQQTIVVSDGNANITADLGFSVAETIITHNNDSSLYDNARGVTNEGAPGAHRLKLSLTFKSVPEGYEGDSNFYRLISIKNGVIQHSPVDDAFGSALMDILAERTYDESGSYTVTPITVTASEDTDDDFINININPSKSYVHGYKVHFKNPTTMKISRGNDTKDVFNYSLNIDGTSYVYTTALDLVNFNTDDIVTIQNAAGTVIGTARVYFMGTGLEGGVTVNKLYLKDIKMYQDLTMVGNNFLPTLLGKEVYTNNTRGYLHSVVGNTLRITGASGIFSPGTLTSDIGNISDVINNVTAYSMSEATQIVGPIATLNIDTNKSVGNANSMLIYDSNIHIKTLLNDGDGGKDVDFTLIRNTQVPVAGTPQHAQVKRLKFAYHRISRAANRTVNYGWDAADREISLIYSDIYQVYGVASYASAAHGFKRLTINTQNTSNSIASQGYKIVGAVSGTEAIITLENGSASATKLAAFGANVNDSLVVTNNATEIEVIITKGSAFTAGESLFVYNTTGVLDNTVTFVSTANTVTNIDMTSNYLVDRGQKAEYYDVGKLVRKATASQPSNDIIVFFSYFEDSTANGEVGSFYCADSYASLDFYDYDVRYEPEPTEIIRKRNNTPIDLRNCIDIRNKVNIITDTSRSPFIFTNRVFTAKPQVEPSTVFKMDLTAYIGRIDTFTLTKEGVYKVQKGIPAFSPKKSSEKITGMKVFDVHIPPVPRYLDEELFIDVVDNRRYTMRDIGTLDKRIDRLEEVVSLNMLESQALHDDVSLRTKMGIIVDDFSTTDNLINTIADISNSSFNCTINTIKQELIPGESGGTPIKVNRTATSGISSFFPNYTIKQFNEEVMISQLSFTGDHKINPFGTWIFEGDMILDPASDSWSIRVNDYFTSLYGDLKPFQGTDEDWKSFQTINTASPGGSSTVVSNWVGNPTTTRTNINSSQIRVDTYRSKTTTTTTTFPEPRPIAGKPPTSTLTGSTVIQKPEDYWMRSLKINYSASGLKATTSHNVYFGEKLISSAVNSDATGKLSGSYTIPSMSFKAGSQTLKVADVKTGGFESYANGVFTSQGFIDRYTVVQDVVKTHTSTITTNELISTQIIRDRDGDRGNRGDPIAQMFMLPFENNNGVSQQYSSIITSVDLWFKVVDNRTNMNKVIVEIRESVNGYPGGPTSTVGTTGEITVAAASAVATPTSTNFTNFKFTTPVKLYSDKEYAIVIKSPSNITSVYIAKMGDALTDGTGVHSVQPNVGGYFGSFFVSQNQTTWSAEQNIDLSFRLNRANFAIGTGGTIPDSTTQYTSVHSDSDAFLADIGAFNRGLAMTTINGSPYVQVSHPNHGFSSGDGVVISVSPDFTISNGVSRADIVGTKTVLYPTLDTYYIRSTTNATATGKINTGIFTTYASQNIVFDSILANYPIIKDDADDVDISVTSRVKGTLYSTLNIGDGTYDSAYYSSIGSTTKTTSIEPNTLINFDDPMVVRSRTANGQSDLILNLTLKSGSKYSSPFFKNTNAIEPIVFRKISAYSNFTPSDIDLIYRDDLANFDTWTDERQASYYAAVQAETENNDYITKEITLEYPAQGLTLFFDADMSPGFKSGTTTVPGSELQVAYKAREVGDDKPFDQIDWVDFPSAQFINQSNYPFFNSYEDFKPYTVRTTNGGNNDDTNIGFEFGSFKIRIRMKVPNAAIGPRIKNLRIIADL